MKIPPSTITVASSAESVKKIKKAPKKQPNSTTRLVNAVTTLNVGQDEAHPFSDGEDDANKRKYDTISD